LFRRGEIDLLVDAAGQVQVAVRGPCQREAARQLVGQGGIVGVILGKQTFGARAVELEPALPGRADRFAQASRSGNQTLVEWVDQITQPREGTRILELYAGSGNLTRALVGADEIVAVDVNPGRSHVGSVVRTVAGRVEQVAGDLAAQGEHFDIVVLDPPRAGAKPAIDHIVQLAAPRIAYVSCDPATLARDLDALTAGGYRAVRALPMDLMPQTAHVEVVVELVRATAGTA